MRSRTSPVETRHQRVDYNFFEGMEVAGIDVKTFSQGRLVWNDGDVRAIHGAGRYIDRPPFAPCYEALKIKHELTRPVAAIREAAE